MQRLKFISKWVFGLFFLWGGLNHFRVTDFYLRMMPPYLPWHLALVYISGIAEIVLGVLLLVPGLRRVAAWGLIALLVAVFPANIHMALHAELFPEFNSALLWGRLPAQALLIVWASWYTGDFMKDDDITAQTSVPATKPIPGRQN